MTYSPHQFTADHYLRHLVTVLHKDVSELGRVLNICEDMIDTPGRRPSADPDGTGRLATRGPSRPTEEIALDEARQDVVAQHRTGITYITHAIAYVRGVRADLDRALSHWEGDEAPELHEGFDGRTDGPAAHP
ncbi:DUF7169 domain-containing protein [Streptomyces varsoviensis]|uniref:DUF7169 domain-containing protein n=1 Tax=Streptomyces varsoviensis TaxID=67373 RepID=UPI003F4CC4E2